MVLRGRPKKEKTLVPLMVLVDPDVKRSLQRAAEVQNKSLSEYAREVLTHWYATR